MLNKAATLNLDEHKITGNAEFTIACTRDATIKSGTVENTGKANGNYHPKAIYVQKANVGLDEMIKPSNKFLCFKLLSL